MTIKALRKFQLFVSVTDGYEYQKAFKDFDTLLAYLNKHNVKNYRVTQSIAISHLAK